MVYCFCFWCYCSLNQSCQGAWHLPTLEPGEEVTHEYSIFRFPDTFFYYQAIKFEFTVNWLHWQTRCSRPSIYETKDSSLVCLDPVSDLESILELLLVNLLKNNHQKVIMPASSESSLLLDTSLPDVIIFRLASNNILSQETVKFYCQNLDGCSNFTGVEKFHATALEQFKQTENLFNDWLLIRGSRRQTGFSDVSSCVILKINLLKLRLVVSLR